MAKASHFEFPGIERVASGIRPKPCENGHVKLQGPSCGSPAGVTGLWALFEVAEVLVFPKKSGCTHFVVAVSAPIKIPRARLNLRTW